MSRMCFVFPNRRSGLFFKRFLLKHCSGTQWAPKIITINELMQEISGLQLADPLDQIIELYTIYSKLAPIPESFDTFFPWGEMMLNDFDTLDKYLVDPELLFKNISELKEIDERFGGLEEEQLEFIRKFWKNFHSGEMTREKDVFLTTWKLLPSLYKKLVAVLHSLGSAYEGMLYRDVAEMDVLKLSEKLEEEHYFFIGFNALSTSEKRFFSKLKNKNLASFYWDYDEKYISDISMEAGRFLRENLKLFPPPADLGIFSNLKNEPLVRIFDLPSDILQAKTVHKLLSEREGRIVNAEDTAIIACDENLLIPVLHSLPEQVDTVNITMGYPFSNTPLNSFIESILRLHRNSLSKASVKDRFYHKDVLSVMNHQYYKLVSGADQQMDIDRIISENRVYLGTSFFTTGSSKQIFREINSVDELVSYLEELLGSILKQLNEEENNYYRELEKEYVLVMIGRLNKILRIIDDRMEIELSTFIRLFRKILAGLRIPFQGEPLAGLQIMGILETRLLDFDHVIMLSVNEEIMPRSSAGHSFIPNSMRYAYGLPTREDMDAIYAYYFYRLIQRAKKVDLLFNSASEGVKSGEMSRYLYQMHYDYKAKIIRPELKIAANEKIPIRINKSEEIIAILNKYLSSEENSSYLSPSALNTYIECSLKFYFRKVAGIGEQEVLLEELDPIGFGNILHKTIHFLYSHLTENNARLTKSQIIQLLKSDLLNETLERIFKEEFYRKGKQRAIEGRNLLIIAILKKYLVKIIETDAEIAPVQILNMEAEYVMDRSLTNKELGVKIGGKIDRIDRPENGNTRIIDYKTGDSDFSFESIASLFDSANKKRNKEAFQAFIYASLYLHENPVNMLMPGLYIVRKLFGDNYSPAFILGASKSGSGQLITDFNEHLEEFTSHLDSLLTEIYNPEIPFVQTEVQDRCKYCDFKGICERG